MPTNTLNETLTCDLFYDAKPITFSVADLSTTITFSTNTSTTSTESTNTSTTSTEGERIKMKDYNAIPMNLEVIEKHVAREFPMIVDINEIVPNKVVEVTIVNGQEDCTYKQVCKEPDVFDLRYALALAWTKNEAHLGIFNSRLTRDGLEYFAKENLCFYTDVIKEIDRAIKAYRAWQKKQEKEAAEEAERIAIIERRKAKNRRRREKMMAKRQEEKINAIIEAIRKSKG